MTTVEVFFCDDDAAVLEAYAQSFRIEGLAVRVFSSVMQLLPKLEPDVACVILTDVRMPRADGFELLRQVHAIDPDIPVVFLTGHGDVPMAVEALRNGAWDFVEKPADPIILVEILNRAAANRAIVLENRRLRAASRDLSSIEGRVLGRSPAAGRLRQTLSELARTSVDVLLLGETGTGKEVAARVLHDFGPNRDGSFVAINCGALPEATIEAELFGHEAGAFTGGDKRRIGKIEYANGGTLFLDEIESMPMPAQIRLLRVLQERTIVRMGSNTEIAVKLRVVSAAKRDLIELSKAGAFREDLAYRLDIARLEIPSLRQRDEDVLILFNHFLTVASQRESRAAPAVSASLRAALVEYDWPGNVREVRNRAERHLLGIEAAVQDKAEFPPTLSLLDSLDRAERSAIAEALEANENRVGRTAEALGISRKTLYLKLRRLRGQR